MSDRMRIEWVRAKNIFERRSILPGCSKHHKREKKFVGSHLTYYLCGGGIR